MIKNNLKYILEQKEKSVYWLAKQTGISQNSLIKIKNDKTSSINFDICNKICSVLECKLEELFEYVPD